MLAGNVWVMYEPHLRSYWCDLKAGWLIRVYITPDCDYEWRIYTKPTARQIRQYKKLAYLLGSD